MRVQVWPQKSRFIETQFKSTLLFLTSLSFLLLTVYPFLCFLLLDRRKEEEKRRKEEEEKKRQREEDVKRRREEEVKRRREVVTRVYKPSKVTSTTTSEEEESNGGRASAPRTRKFLNLFANNSSHYSATGKLIV